MRGIRCTVQKCFMFGVRCKNVRCKNVRCKNVRCKNVRCKNVRCKNVRCSVFGAELYGDAILTRVIKRHYFDSGDITGIYVYLVVVISGYFVPESL